MELASFPTVACIGDAEHVDYSYLCHHVERTRLQLYRLCVLFDCFCPDTAHAHFGFIAYAKRRLFFCRDSSGGGRIYSFVVHISSTCLCMNNHTMLKRTSLNRAKAKGDHRALTLVKQTRLCESHMFGHSTDGLVEY